MDLLLTRLPQPISHWLATAQFEQLFLLLLAPVFLVTIAVELLWWRARGRDVYQWRDTLNNSVLALSHQAADALAWSLLLGLFYAVWRHRLFDIPFNLASVILLYVLQDFLYYWFHRASHRIRWMWASHVVHHSQESLNLSTAFRQSLTYPISGMWVFWLPLAWIGFKPEHIVLCVAVNLAYQFFVHTEAVNKLPRAYEWLFNTPSHHRVHHARNPQYIDRNYAGVLVIWDRLFGSFVPEDPADPCDYGITRQLKTRNPIRMMFHEWIDLFRDVARPGPLWLRTKHLWAPPEWQRENSAVQTARRASVQASRTR
ncbi:MAG: sterol desaturase family protein [Pseudomonadota bacterium]|nr:sterol desaturase family protein [Pseudomonadota bacterium]